MVIGQILGLPIAFGSGQLSGAGFGPNYTILMKLGYEFYAPRILDEMQKNPDKSFENTKYWRAFQTHLKSYTDKVMIQTMDSLAAFPKDTLDALVAKFGSYIIDGIEGGTDNTTTSTSASNLGSQLVTIRLDLGQGFRREGEGSQQQGTSLFDLDQLAKREAVNKKLQKEGLEAIAFQSKKGTSISTNILQQGSKQVQAIAQGSKVSVAQKGPKQKAGQSVKLELKKLQTEILQFVNSLRKIQQAYSLWSQMAGKSNREQAYRIHWNSGTNNTTQSTFTTAISKMGNKILKNQKGVAGLMARYYFA